MASRLTSGVISALCYHEIMTNAATQLRPVQRTIRLRTQHPRIAQEIAEIYKLSPVAARVLAARGHKNDVTLKNFITPTLREGLPDPQELKNAGAAAQLIGDFVRRNVPIAICCDFDVDGLSGGAQLLHFLISVGATAKVFVPDRFTDGYGLNERMVREIASAGFGLLVTVDYGTRNHNELDLAASLGLKTVVIDHHHVAGDPPRCDVFINPQQKGCGFAGGVLCASGIVWILLSQIRKVISSATKLEIKNYLDLACLGTICDMVPLTGANRVIAKRGLEMLKQTNRAGLMALKNVSGIYGEVSCSHVSFGIGPRLNAAGRMVHGEMVIELLTTLDSDKASKIAKQLNKLNLERQDTENRVKDQAIEQIRKRNALHNGIVVWDRDFHTGVIGIVAQRLVENFYRPSVVMGLDTDGIFKGSVRGIRGFSVVEALESVSTHLIKCGGHEGAGGFSVYEKNIEAFAEAFISECDRRLENIETEPVVDADTEATLSEVDLELVSELQRFAPFGMGNPGPVLQISNLKVMEVKVLKNAHIKATLSDGKRYLTGLLWRQNNHPALIAGTRVNIACKPDSSTFNGTLELQANLQAIERA